MQTNKIIFYLLFIATFLGGLRNEAATGSDSIRNLRIVILICLFLYSITVLAKLKSLKYPKTILWYIAFLSYSTTTLLWAPQKIFGGWKIFELITTLTVILTCYQTSSFQSNPKLIYKTFILLIKVAVIGVVVSSCIYPETAFEAINSPILPVKLHGSIYVMNSNDLGFWAGLLFVLSVHQYSHFRFHRVFFIFLYLSVLIMSQSRFFIALSILITLTILSGKKQKIIFYMLLLFSLPLIVYIIPEIEHFFTRGNDSQLLSLHGRIYFWGLGMRHFLDSWILGKGFYVGHRFLYLITPNETFNSSTFDSTWIDVLVDTGIIGAFLLMGFIIRISLILKSITNRHKKEFTFGIIFLLLRSLVGPSFQSFGLFVIYLLVIAVTITKIYSDELCKSKSTYVPKHAPHSHNHLQSP